MMRKLEKGSPCAGLDSAKRGEAGQILLIVILVVIVVSTIGLSLISRSIISLKSSTEEAESQKALAAAEAGIERALQSNVPISNTSLSNNSRYSADILQINGSEFSLNGGNPVPKDDGIDIWFEGHNSDGTRNGSFTSVSIPNLFWGSSSACGGSDAPAAIQVIAITEDGSGNVKTYRYAYDSCNRGNNFTLAETGSYNVFGVTFANKTPNNHLASGIPASEDVVFMRVVPLYKDTIIGVRNGNALPSQGYQVESIGISGSANRKLTVFKGWPQTPLPYLSYGLFVAN